MITHDLVDGACLSRKRIIQQPPKTTCNELQKMEIKSNNGVIKKIMRCDNQTGQAQLITRVWMPQNCKCIKRTKVLLEGLCSKFSMIILF